MKIAVTYDNGNVFEHFGKTESFKVYEVSEGQVVSSEIVNPNCEGHEAVAGFLAENDIVAVICGGMGEGALNACMAAGITVFSGQEGSADEAVEKLLRGELTNAGANCDCGGNCGDGCGNCGGGCGGCGGGCGGGQLQPLFEGKNVMKKVSVHYRGTFNDGKVFDSSYDREEPLNFICGVGMMIPGFDKAVAEMNVGDKVDIHLMPEEAYGEKDEQAIFTVNLSDLPGAENLNVGERVLLSNPMGQQFPVEVAAKDETTITFDANHELAGVELNFLIELLAVED